MGEYEQIIEINENIPCERKLSLKINPTRRSNLPKEYSFYALSK